MFEEPHSETQLGAYGLKPGGRLSPNCETSVNGTQVVALPFWLHASTQWHWAST